MKLFKVGDLFIINDCDRPCAELVAIVTAVKNGLYAWRYINKDKRLKNYGCKKTEATLKLATLLSDFGVDLCIFQKEYWCKTIGESVAKYPDGVARKWQGSDWEKYEITESAQKLLAESQKVEVAQ